MRDKFTYLILLVLVLLIQGCASFEKGLENPNPLNKKNLTELNGSYGIVHKDFDSISKWDGSQVWVSDNFIKEIDRKLIRDTVKIDSLRKYSFQLKVISTDKIKITYLENGEKFKEQILKSKLKDDGYLYLKNQNVKLLFVPLIFGRLDIKKIRLTKSNDGNLIFDVAKRTVGGFLLIIAGGHYNKYRNEYYQIE